jgi:hypothetical protein
MKLRNKKTGEIGTLCQWGEGGFNRVWVEADGKRYDIASLAELECEWQDYEEPKEWWYIDIAGEVKQGEGNVPEHLLAGMKQIGNYFETKEEAEKAVKKLKAWKRLKDKGFRFHEWYKPDGCEPFIVIETNIDYDDIDNMGMQKDLDLLFGGEE